MTAELGEGEVVQILDWIGITPERDEALLNLEVTCHSDREQTKQHGRQTASAAIGARRVNPTIRKKSKTGVKR
jgi:hypothetical protein